MPKELTIKAFRFSELASSAQESAKHAVGDHWYEFEFEDAKQVIASELQQAGLPVKDVAIECEEHKNNPLELFADLGFTQGSGSSLEGIFTGSDVDECEPLMDVMTDFPHLHRDGITFILTARDNHYCHEYTMKLEVEYTADAVTVDLEDLDMDRIGEEDRYIDLIEAPLEKIGERALEAIRTLVKDAHSKGESHILSDCDGYIGEWMDNMGYWFDADGQIIERGN